MCEVQIVIWDGSFDMAVIHTHLELYLLITVKVLGPNVVLQEGLVHYLLTGSPFLDELWVDSAITAAAYAFLIKPQTFWSIFRTIFLMRRILPG